MKQGDFNNQKSGQKEGTCQQISDSEVALEIKMATRDVNQHVVDGKLECCGVDGDQELEMQVRTREAEGTHTSQEPSQRRNDDTVIGSKVW